MDNLDIVIVNWNSGQQLQECLDSILQYGQCSTGHIIIVDNGSIDDSASRVEEIPTVTLIRAGTNLGFARACNMGALHSCSEFLLFLNPDTRLLPGSLGKVIEFARAPENRKVGIFGVQLVDEDGHITSSCSRFPSVSGFIAHATGLNRIFPGLGHSMKEWDHLTTQRVDQVMGAYFLVRRDLFKAIGGFDEQFFVYFEEVDFSYRAMQLGWFSTYFSGAQVFHAGGGTSKQIKAKRLFYSLRSRILYVFKHFNIFGAITVGLVTLLIEPVSRSMLGMRRHSISSVKETWEAYGMLLRWLFRRILVKKTD
ncbi:glycosyltransferase family 2 protein [Geothrix campi]|uniref:glycosyltransferase family 2 protein n=1 Tax=Geothrix campi TaxID=2966450 RepID=UPI0021490612|nr:glycosyltransferase family 2 protein [Geothrix sp. SG10]